MYYLGFDEEGYLNSISFESFSGCVPYNKEIPNIRTIDISNYKLINGTLWLDEEKAYKTAHNFEINEQIDLLEDSISKLNYFSFFEGLLDVMMNSTALNLIANIISYMSNIRKNYNEILKQKQQILAMIEELRKQLL